MNDDMVLFGERLKETRAKRGLTQKELAEAAGVSPNTIVACEKALKKPSLDLARKLAEYLGVSLDWLCGLTVINNEPMFADLIKALVDLSNVFPFQIEVVYPAMGNPNADSKGAISFCLGTIEENEAPYSVYFLNRVDRLLRDWAKMLDLVRIGTLPKDLYDLWLEKQIHDNTQIQLLDESEAFQEIRKINGFE